MSDQSLALIIQLKQSFIDEGVQINAPASQDEIAAFEKKYPVKLPIILRHYFSVFNGTGAENFGNDGFAFFSLDEVKLVREIMSETEPDKDAYPDCYVFSDYLCWCWGYAVQLNDEGTDGLVFQVSGTQPPPRLISTSFRAFIEDYLSDSDRLI
ncbi:MAG: SMI1/KNR4 family protein [Moraxellaceae bacterium]